MKSKYTYRNLEISCDSRMGYGRILTIIELSKRRSWQWKIFFKGSIQEQELEIVAKTISDELKIKWMQLIIKKYDTDFLDCLERF